MFACLYGANGKKAVENPDSKTGHPLYNCFVAVASATYGGQSTDFELEVLTTPHNEPTFVWKDFARQNGGLINQSYAEVE